MTAFLLAIALAASPAAAPPVIASVAQLRALPALHARGTHVVHFWATWCAPCVEELPGFVARAKVLAGAGVDFTFVSVDAPADFAGKVAPMFAKAGGAFPGAKLWILGEDLDPGPIEDVFDPKWDGGLPATFVFRDGVRIGEYRGAEEAHALEGLGPKPPAPAAAPAQPQPGSSAK